MENEISFFVTKRISIIEETIFLKFEKAILITFYLSQNNMKIFNVSILSICLFLINLNAFGQPCCPRIVSISSIPNNPNFNDIIKIVTLAGTPGTGKILNQNFYLKNDTVFLDYCYFMGFDLSPTPVLDTFKIGLLPEGRYIVNLRAYQSWEPNNALT